MLANDRIERGIEGLLFARRVRQQVAAQEACQPVEQFDEVCGVEFGDASLYLSGVVIQCIREGAVMRANRGA